MAYTPLIQNTLFFSLTDAYVSDIVEAKRAVDLKKQSSVSGSLDFPDKGRLF